MLAISDSNKYLFSLAVQKKQRGRDPHHRVKRGFEKMRLT
jgi:hypothetical protein